MKRFIVTVELAGGDYTLGAVDSIHEANALVDLNKDRRTRIYDRCDFVYLDSKDGFWRNTTGGTPSKLRQEDMAD